MNDVLAELRASQIPARAQPFVLGLCMGEGGIDENAWRRCYGGALYEGPLTAHFSPTNKLWPGKDNSHALGAGQFQPGTYEETAKRTSLPTLEPQSQLANTWDLAQHVYLLRTKRQLLGDLAESRQVQAWDTLKETWTSLGLTTRAAHFATALKLLGDPMDTENTSPPPVPAEPIPPTPASPQAPLAPLDREIKAIAASYAIVKDLPAEAQARILAYLISRFGSKAPA